MDTTRHNKAELLRLTDAAWTQLNSALDALTPQQLTDIRDPAGWAVKDHLVHLAAWERSVVVVLQGRPRHEGLGIAEAVYDSGDEDAINAAIQAQGQDTPPATALAELRAGHSRLLSLVAPLTDVDLYKAVSDYLPASPDDLDTRPLLGLIYSNTAHHFGEHQAWIASLVGQGSPTAPADLRA